MPQMKLAIQLSCDGSTFFDASETPINLEAPEYRRLYQKSPRSSECRDPATQATALWPDVHSALGAADACPDVSGWVELCSSRVDRINAGQECPIWQP